MPADTGERRRLTAAVLGEHAAPVPTPPAAVARGVVVGATSYLLRLAGPDGEQRLLVGPETSFWKGGEADHSDLRVGDDAIVRCVPGAGLLAERVWAQAARVTGVITGGDGDTLEVDTGHGRPPQRVVIPYRHSGRMGVRHPRLEPGYLFDAIGVWRDGQVRAVRPATTQPPYPVQDAPRRPPARAGTMAVAGVATWYDPALGRASHLDPRARLAGAAYPALEPEPGEACDAVPSCLPLPRLSAGTTFRLRNDRTGESAVLPVLGCAAADSRLCDSCAAPGVRHRGRLARLTALSFVSLGGRLEAGCFDATLTAGWGGGA